MSHAPAKPRVVPARVLGRSLVLWGAGHLALGLRRGWLFVASEVAFVALLGLVLLPRASGTSADLVFAVLALFFVTWAAQAVDACRMARRMADGPAEGEAEGGARTGAEDTAQPPIAGAVPEARRPAALLLLTLFVPATVAFTAFWMAAGIGATPESALEHYVVAWRAGQADRAVAHLAAPLAPQALDTRWREQENRIVSRLLEIARDAGDGNGVDPERPFASLEFTLEPAAAGAAPGSASAAVNVVRRVQVRETFLGVFPTASLRTVVVERIGTVRLGLVALAPPFGLGPEDHAWRVTEVVILPSP